MEIIKLFFKLIKYYKNQAKCLKLKDLKGYKEIQLKIDELYNEIHAVLAIKYLNRHLFIRCKCGNDLYDGLSKILFEDDDRVELVECRKCGNLNCVSFELGPVGMVIDFEIKDGKLICDGPFDENTEIYKSLNKLLDEYYNIIKEENYND